MSRRLQHLTLLLLLSLVLTSCNRVGLAYRNLDVIIPWTLNDYLEMNREQKIWFNERLKEHLSWHCGTQLPGYLDYLDRLQQMVERNQVNDAELQEFTREAKQAIAQTARAIAPSAIELLRGLDDQQVAEMKAAFAKDMRQRRSKYLKLPLEQQIRLRAERMDKRLTTWLGSLTPEQTRRVADWSTSSANRTSSGSPTGPTGRRSSVPRWNNARTATSTNASSACWWIAKASGHRLIARPMPTANRRRATCWWT